MKPGANIPFPDMNYVSVLYVFVFIVALADWSYRGKTEFCPQSGPGNTNEGRFT